MCVWDAFTRKLVAKAKGDVAAAPGQAAGGGPAAQFPGYVVSLSWHPQGNALLVMNASGKVRQGALASWRCKGKRRTKSNHRCACSSVGDLVARR